MSTCYEKKKCASRSRGESKLTDAKRKQKRVKRIQKRVTFAKQEFETFIFEIPVAEGLDEEDVDGKEDEARTTVLSEEFTVLSSLHGKARRELRDISKPDLQSVKKNGVKTKGHPCPSTGLPRWKYVYGNIVYITDYTSTVEVTSYKEAIQIQPASITPEMEAQHLADVESLRENPQICVTHTIIVIDQSGSMRTSDVHGFRTRSQAAYGVLALDFISERLLAQGDDNVVDTMTIIEMNDSGTIVFDREPLDWVLFNKVLERQKSATPRSHGRYNNSLSLARDIVEKEKYAYDDPDDLPLYMILFISDGKPSDSTVDDRLIRENAVHCLGTMLRDKLTFCTIGLGKNSNDFAVLKYMVEIAESCGCEGSFNHAELSGALLSTTLSSMATSMTATRTEMFEVDKNKTGKKRLKKNFQLRDPSIPLWQRSFHDFFRGVERFTFDNGEYKRGQDPWKVVDFKNNGAVGFKMEAQPFGNGVERLAHLFYEIDSNGKQLGKPYVAKETINMDDEQHKMQFHEDFCRVQRKANKLAQEFNHVVKKTPSLQPVDDYSRTPMIRFVKCFVYQYEADDGKLCGVLVEDFLNGKFHKYNSNTKFALKEKDGITIDLEIGEVFFTDFLQAFSHWVFFSSGHEQLVCDLQGILNKESRYPSFQLTDPAICTRGKSCKRYGNTDIGMKAFRGFRRSHKCNGVCKGLGLPQFGSK